MEESQNKSLTPFDFTSSIMKKNVNLMTGSENDELAERAYVPFVVNRVFALDVATVLYANEMNMFHHLPNKLQYEYLLNSVRKGGKWHKWIKAEDDETIDTIRQFFKCSVSRARQAMQILSAEQITIIKKRLEKGT